MGCGGCGRRGIAQQRSPTPTRPLAKAEKSTRCIERRNWASSGWTRIPSSPPVRTISVSSSALGMKSAWTIELMIMPVATKAKNGSFVQPVPRPISGVKVKTRR